MPLQLITGPANSAKAGAVLDAYRAALDRAPILVVPTRADVDHYRLELAATGAVVGARVEHFNGLIREAARRAEVAGRVVGRVARERIASAAIAGTGLEVLDEVARSRGFTRAALALFAELEEHGVEPPRLTSALRSWAEEGSRRAYADDVSALYTAYRRTLGRVGVTDAELHTRGVLETLRRDPARWGSTPAFFYGFDDLSALQLDAIETLARVVDAPVTVSLPYEPGRAALAGRATAYETLLPLADDHFQLEPLDDHYAAAGRAALHHLERHLFDPTAARIEAGGGVVLLEGAGERAELELVAEQINELLADGYAPSEIGVVVRASPATASLIAEVFSAAGVPFAMDRTLRCTDTALGRGMLGLLRLALLDGGTADLLAYLRTPGVVAQPQLLDRLEAEIRREGLSAAVAVERWEWPLEAVERLRIADRRGSRALIDCVILELDRLFAKPRQRAAAVVEGPAQDDASAHSALRRALAELQELGGLAPGGGELLHALEELELTVAAEPGEAVTVTDPLALRARRVRGLFVCRLQEGVFPRATRPEPFFSEGDRGAIAAASGLLLARGPDGLSAERYLFYATVSRPLERLILSWHAQADDGTPALRSLFVDEVCDLLDLNPVTRRSPRPPHDAVAGAETEGERLRAERVVQSIRERDAWSPSSLETCARCPVRWLVERQLRVEDVEPEVTHFVRGRLVHEVLRQTFSRLGERTGSARIDERSLGAAQEVMREALREIAPAYRISVNPDRLRTALREVELDLERYLEQAARWGASYEPRHLELEFGPISLASDRLRVAGRIDRVDVDAGGGRAVVYDYKGREVDRPDDWLERRTIQLSLYMLAAARVLGHGVVGGFYQPVGARPDGRRARGLLADGADDAIACVRGDRRDADEIASLLDDAVRIALDAVSRLEAGELEAQPETCGRDGRCAYPTICRIERA